jgi:sulfatase maturation enzyme AslB (radical SAM superfamily)
MVRLSIVEWYGDEPTMVPLPVEEDANELRFKIEGREAFVSAKVSISALSASALLGGPSSEGNVSR